jgi:hypothetical protein
LAAEAASIEAAWVPSAMARVNPPATMPIRLIAWVGVLRRDRNMGISFAVGHQVYDDLVAMDCPNWGAAN